MGRFYRTAQGEFIDNKMYQPPIELMTQVINNIDSQIQKNETAMLSLYDKLQADALAADEPRLREIINGYTSQIDELAAKIQENPLEFRRETGTIRNLGRKINDDWSQGEVSVIQGNKATRDAFVKNYLDRVKEKNGNILQQDVNNAINLFDTMYNNKGGAQWKSPTEYNQYYTENLNPYVDVNEIADKVGDGWKADLQSQGYAYNNGQWIRKGTNGQEIASEKDIRNAIIKRLNNDQELVNYYQQQVKFGFMTPEKLEEKFLDAADVYAKKHGYIKNTSTADIDANPYSLENLRNQNDINKMHLANKLAKDLEDYKANITAIEELGTSERETFLTPEQLKAQNNTVNVSLGQIAGSIGVKGVVDGKYNLAGIRERLVKLKNEAKRTGDTEALNEISSYWSQLQYATSLMGKNTAEASWASGLQIMQPKQLVAAKKDYTEILKDPGQLGNVKQSWKINGRRYDGISINDVYRNPKKYGLPENTFTENDMELKDMYNQGSIRPVIKSGSNYNLNSMNTTWNIPGVDIESNVSWSKIGISTGEAE